VAILKTFWYIPEQHKKIMANSPKAVTDDVMGLE
jgi:hypothetical protein